MKGASAVSRYANNFHFDTVAKSANPSGATGLVLIVKDAIK